MTLVPINAFIPPSRIRVLALGLVFHQTRLLVAEGYDTVKQSTFYRALGGEVEFGESSREALEREFWEEICAGLANIEYLGCLENLFEYEGKAGHEIIQLYKCDLQDPTFYQQEVIVGDEGGDRFLARWIEGDRFHTRELNLVPAACLTYLRA